MFFCKWGSVEVYGPAVLVICSVQCVGVYLPIVKLAASRGERPVSMVGSVSGFCKHVTESGAAFLGNSTTGRLPGVSFPQQGL